VLLCFIGIAGLQAGDPVAAERRALEYLAREVPRWSLDNKCYSCHNNGDAARALYTAKRLKRTVPEKSLADTTAWLTRPADWEHNGGEGEFSDKKLAAIQFAFALATAKQAGSADDPAALQAAARIVAAGQDADGSWKIDASGSLGAPATYGRFLATAAGRNTLAQAGPLFSEPVARADRWLLQSQPKAVLDAAAVLIGLQDCDHTLAKEQRARCLERIRRGEARSGGWGPYVTSPPEPFDTAVVLLGLLSVRHEPAVAQMIARGRRFLIDAQQEDGSWPETTRPPGGISYAQRLSTTGWATQALLVTATQGG
jgi:hypothetical protein